MVPREPEGDPMTPTDHALKQIRKCFDQASNTLWQEAENEVLIDNAQIIANEGGSE